MKDHKRKILKEKVRRRLESYFQQNNIKYSKKILAEKTQGEIDAEKKEMDQRIKTKEEQIKALQDQIAVLKTAQGKAASEKPDETSG